MRFEPDGSKAREHWRTLTPSRSVATHMPAAIGRIFSSIDWRLLRHRLFF